MITTKEAFQLIMDTSRDFGIEEVPIDRATGRVLREVLFADRDFPPFDRVTMDGIAIAAATFENGNRVFPVEGIAAAGAPQKQLQNKSNCLEVMTGAIAPIGIDTVIRYEDLEIKDGLAKILIDPSKAKQNIHGQGTDRAKGSKIVTPGVQITGAEIGVAATVGKAKLQVSKLPKAVVISTGDELVDVSKTPLAHQIRRSNSASIKASLERYGIQAEAVHLDDDWSAILERLKNILTTYDLIILSGGVSMGKYDYLPKAFAALGVKKAFHKVKQRPGKPFWFGTTNNGNAVFALPGNPVSTFMCTQRYVIPWLESSLGIREAKKAFAVLGEEVVFNPDLVYYMQVALRFDAYGRQLAYPKRGNGSGDLASLVEADGFLELPRGKNIFLKGEVFKVYRYRQ